MATLRAEAPLATMLGKPGLPLFLFSTGMMATGALSVISGDLPSTGNPSLHSILDAKCSRFSVASSSSP
jgi:hypothetical protein